MIKTSLLLDLQVQFIEIKIPTAASSHSVRDLPDGKSCGVQEMKQGLHFCTESSMAFLY